MFGLESKHFYSITLILALVGAILTAYWGVLSTLEAQKIAMSAYETRLQFVESEVKSIHQENKELASEMRATLNQVGNNVADLRVEIGKLIVSNGTAGGKR